MAARQGAKGTRVHEVFSAHQSNASAGDPHQPTRSLADVRRHNLRHTLQAIRERGPITRKELIVTTGLNRVTVLDLVAELHEVGVIEELNPQSTGRSGRPARALDIDAAHLAVGALEFNVGYVSFALATLRGEFLASRRVYISEDYDADSVVEIAAGMLIDAVAVCEPAGRRLVHVTVACIGVVDHREGSIIKSSALGWSYVPVIAELERRVPDPPIFAIDNLANVAINAERQVRNWPADAGVVMLYGDIGVGGAYVRGPNMLRGDFESGAIFGHISVNTEGRRCYCGRRGCLETYVGIGPLANALTDNPNVCYRTEHSHGQGLTRGRYAADAAGAYRHGQEEGIGDGLTGLRWSWGRRPGRPPFFSLLTGRFRR